MDESIPERMTTVVRGLTDEPFTIVANSALEDPSVSFKAKGLLVFMCSRPTDWHFTREWLTAQGPDGERSIRSGLKELTEAEYTRREAVRGEGQRGIVRHVLLVRASRSLPWPVLQGGFQPVENQPVQNVGLPSNELPKNDSPSNPPTRAVTPKTPAQSAASVGLDPGPAERDGAFNEVFDRWPRTTQTRSPSYRAWRDVRSEFGAHANEITAACIHYADHMKGSGFAKSMKSFLTGKTAEWRDWVDGPPPKWKPPSDVEAPNMDIGKLLDEAGIEFDPEDAA